MDQTNPSGQESCGVNYSSNPRDENSSLGIKKISLWLYLIPQLVLTGSSNNEKQNFFPNPILFLFTFVFAYFL